MLSDDSLIVSDDEEDDQFSLSSAGHGGMYHVLKYACKLLDTNAKITNLRFYLPNLSC